MISWVFCLVLVWIFLFSCVTFCHWTLSKLQVFMEGKTNTQFHLTLISNPTARALSAYRASSGACVGDTGSLFKVHAIYTHEIKVWSKELLCFLLGSLQSLSWDLPGGVYFPLPAPWLVVSWGRGRSLSAHWGTWWPVPSFLSAVLVR